MALAAGALLIAACGETPEPAADAGPVSLTVYSGRNESLVGPLLSRFGDSSGLEVNVRYASTAELTATLLEEGEGTPADVFFSQDAAALGALSAAGRLKSLDPELLERVDARFRSPAGDWVGVSGRARSVVYNSELVDPAELPQSLAEVTDPKYRGRFGVAPTNASFQAHMAVVHALRGREALEELLAGMVANEARPYPKNSAIVEAVIAGEVEWGLVNHYYLWRALSERPEAPGVNYYMRGDDGSAFVNVAGVGVLSDSPAATALVDYLLSAEGQEYFAGETFEYPLAAGVEPGAELPPLAELDTAEVDFAQVSAVFEDTLALINASGLVE